jgi:hypothetical protein
VVGADALALIDRAIKRSRENISRDHLLGEILGGRATVFSGERSVMVCTLHEYADGARQGHVWLAAGDLSELRGPMREQAEMWAKANGADTATIDGRAGWKRALRGVGFGGSDELEKVL